MKGLILEVKITKIIGCYENKGLPLHQECPYGKNQIDTNCNICCRKNEKVLKIETLNEKRFCFKGLKKILYRFLFGRF